MTDKLTRLLYLVNHCPGFLPTRDQWEEVGKLVNELAEEERMPLTIRQESEPCAKPAEI